MNRLEKLQEELDLINEREAVLKELITLEKNGTIETLAKNIMADIVALHDEQSLTLLKSKKTPMSITLAGYDFELHEGRPNSYVSRNETFLGNFRYSVKNKTYEIGIEPKVKSGYVGSHAGINLNRWHVFKFPLETK